MDKNLKIVFFLSALILILGIGFSVFIFLTHEPPSMIYDDNNIRVELIGYLKSGIPETCKMDFSQDELKYVANWVTLKSVICLAEADNYMDLKGHKSGAEFINWLETLMAVSLELEKLDYTQQRTSIKRGNLNYEISKTSYKRADKNLDQYWIFFECGGKRYLISAIYAENNDSEAEKEKLLNSIKCQNLRIQKIHPTQPALT